MKKIKMKRARKAEQRELILLEQRMQFKWRPLKVHTYIYCTKRVHECSVHLVKIMKQDENIRKMVLELTYTQTISAGDMIAIGAKFECPAKYRRQNR